MRIIRDWRTVLGKAWSVRFIILAGILTGLEVALPFLEFAVPPGLFALMSGAATAAALIARFTAQRGIAEGPR